MCHVLWYRSGSRVLPLEFQRTWLARPCPKMCWTGTRSSKSQHTNVGFKLHLQSSYCTLACLRNGFGIPSYAMPNALIFLVWPSLSHLENGSSIDSNLPSILRLFRWSFSGKRNDTIDGSYLRIMLQLLSWLGIRITWTCCTLACLFWHATRWMTFS